MNMNISKILTPKEAAMTERRFTPIQNIKELAEHIRDFGDKIAFLYRDSGDVVISVSYGDFYNMLKKQSAGFRALGLEGKRIAIIGETSVAWLSTYFATVAAGGVAIPLDKELKVEELEGFLEFSEADAIVFSKFFNAKFENTVKTHSTLKKFIPMDIEGCAYLDNEKVISLTDVLELGAQGISNGYEFPECTDADRMAEMLFTSGTTGTSKCVMLSEKNVCAAINSACTTVDFCPEDRILSVLPIHHTYELCCLLAGLNYGMEIAINDSLKRVLKNLKTFQPTGIVLVPLFVNTMYKKIWDEVRKKKKEKLLKFSLKASYNLRRFNIDLRKKLFNEVTAAFGGKLKKMVCGGAPLNPEMTACFAEFGINLVEGYGITECSPLVAVTPYFNHKRGSVGPAVPSCTVKIDADHRNNLGFGEGEILVKGDNVMLGYYKNPEATAEVFTEDGWFKTGDVGYMDQDGYIYITGRKKYVIVLENGKNVFPEEIEEYLGAIDTIAESVVLGRKTEGSTSLTLTAIIFPQLDKFENAEDHELIEQTIKDQVLAMNKKLPTYKQIRDFEFRYTEFEKTTSRKIKRHLVQ